LFLLSSAAPNGVSDAKIAVAEARISRPPPLLRRSIAKETASGDTLNFAAALAMGSW
jgi:hypothetical protein